MNDYEREHNEIMRRFGAECAVLLKSDGAFPLEAPCRLGLYGSGARRTIKGGTGSGEVNSRYFVTVEDGLEAAGFHITSKFWMDRYEQIRAEAKKRFIRELKLSALRRGTLAVIDCMGAVMPEPEYDIPLWGGGEAAVYVLSRISGEGSDRGAVPGDILLTETEKRDILALNARYEKFLLVLNVGGAVDLSPPAAEPARRRDRQHPCRSHPRQKLSLRQADHDLERLGGLRLRRRVRRKGRHPLHRGRVRRLPLF